MSSQDNSVAELSNNTTDAPLKVHPSSVQERNYAMQLDIDSEESDADSALGLTLKSSDSVTSSIYDSVEENGRTYHSYKSGKYFLPNDLGEQERLDLQHHLSLLTFDGKLNMAPVENPAWVLDIGTGTGIWAIDFASQNPNSNVIGSDLSPIQPEYVPTNCSFEVDDAEDEWVYSQQFNYIHGRAMFTCFKDPPVVFRHAFNALAPGGYFEMQDFYFKPHSADGTIDGTALQRWNALLIEGAAKLGRDWYCTLNYERWFKEIGFEDVTVKVYLWPLNQWPKGKKHKMMGLMTQRNILDGLGAASLAVLTRGLGMTAEEVETLLVDVRKDIGNKDIHAYYPVYVVYGRKPLEADG